MRTAPRRRQAFRRTRRTAVGTGCIALLTFVVTAPGGAAPGAPAQEAFNNGTGSATALGYKVNPTNGNLKLGLTAGESVSGHQNTAATGQARAINLGVIGVTLAGEGCDGGSATLPAEQQPQPVIARSGEDGAAEGKSEQEAGAIEKFARATTDPFAEAITNIAPSGDPATAFISGGRTISHSGVVNGNVREALARTELGEVSLAGGAIKLRGLTWQAIHRSGAVNETLGSFTIEGLVIADQPVSLPGEGLQQLDALGAALRPLGFDITTPKVRVEQGIVFVDPMKIAVIPSPTRDGIIGPIIGGAQPIRDAVTKALLDADCGNSTYITLADIALGGVSGAGQVGLELGGVQATTAEIQRFQFALAPALPSLSAPAIPATSGLSTSGGTSSLPGSTTPGAATAAPAAQTGGTAGSGQIAASPVSALSGERGGIMAAISAGGLLLLLGTAEGDRRKMRSAQRALPMED